MNDVQTLLYRKMEEVNKYIEELYEMKESFQRRLTDTESQILRQKKIYKEIEDVYETL